MQTNRPTKRSERGSGQMLTTWTPTLSIPSALLASVLIAGCGSSGAKSAADMRAQAGAPNAMAGADASGRSGAPAGTGAVQAGTAGADPSTVVAPIGDAGPSTNQDGGGMASDAASSSPSNAGTGGSSSIEPTRDGGSLEPAACTMNGNECPAGWGCFCSSHTGQPPLTCTCRERCESAADCEGQRNLCGCGGGINGGLCMSLCDCACGGG